jgi:predicted nucleic acid-binding protein
MEEPKKIITDCSTVMSVILEEGTKQRIISATSGVVLCAPSIINIEVANALSRGFKRKRYKEIQVVQAFAAFKKLKIKTLRINYKGLLSIACAYNIYAYDAAYLEVASRLCCPLISLDSGMQNVASNMKIELVEV